MRFRVKNLSSDNHRVEFVSRMNGAFRADAPESGDVVLSPDGREWNACLTNLKGANVDLGATTQTYEDGSLDV